MSGLCAEGWSNGLDYSLLCKYLSVVEEVLNAKLFTFEPFCEIS